MPLLWVMKIKKRVFDFRQRYRKDVTSGLQKLTFRQVIWHWRGFFWRFRLSIGCTSLPVFGWIFFFNLQNDHLDFYRSNVRSSLPVWKTHFSRNTLLRVWGFHFSTGSGGTRKTLLSISISRLFDKKWHRDRNPSLPVRQLFDRYRLRLGNPSLPAPKSHFSIESNVMPESCSLRTQKSWLSIQM